MNWTPGAPIRGTVIKTAICRHCARPIYWDRSTSEWRHRHSHWVQCGEPA